MVGWSVAGMEGMEAKLVAFGPVPTKLLVQRGIIRAELFGFLQLLRFSQPPIRAVTDHLGIRQGLKKREQWCTAATRAHVDVWRLVWDRWKDIGGEEGGHAVVHCKAHRTKEQIKKLDLQGNNDVAGNVVADRWAKEGASMDRGFGREMALQADMARVEQAATMILESHALVDSKWEDLCPKAEWQAVTDKKKSQRGGGLVVSKEGVLRHSIRPYCNLVWEHIGWSCDRCRAWART